MQPNPEKLTQEQDALALASMTLREHDEIVAYRVDGGVDILRLIETGEVALRTIGLSGTDETFSFEQPIKEPLLDESFQSLHDYVTALDIDYRTPKLKKLHQYGKREQEPPLDDARAAILKRAAEVAESLDDSDHYESCLSECIAGIKNVSCWCTSSGGSSYTDLDGKTVKQRVRGEADPECRKCEGEGRYDTICGDCCGSGQVIINPVVTVINDTTHEEQSFRFDVAALLASGAISLALQSTPHQYFNVRSRNPNPLPPQVHTSLDFVPYMTELASAVGIDIENEEYYTYWGPEPVENQFTTFGYLTKEFVGGMVTAPTAYDSLEQFSETALLELQRSAFARLRRDMYRLDKDTATAEEIIAYGRTYDLIMNDSLAVTHIGLRLDKPASSSEALQELISTLALYDKRLGFTHTGIATGETGPALFMLDQAGNLEAELSAGYETAIVLETARQTIREAYEKGLLARTEQP